MPPGETITLKSWLTNGGGTNEFARTSAWQERNRLRSHRYRHQNRLDKTKSPQVEKQSSPSHMTNGGGTKEFARTSAWQERNRLHKQWNCEHFLALFLSSLLRAKVDLGGCQEVLVEASCNKVTYPSPKYLQKNG
jgi:hypothetical protein